MSRPKYWWYGNVCRTIREYPELKRIVRDASQQKITPGYAAASGGRSSGRAVEDLTTRILSMREYADYSAVQAAINAARTWRDGADVLEIVRLSMWTRPQESIESAARYAHVSTSTAKRMRGRFIDAAARELGYKEG